MIKNNFLLAIRNLFKHKQYALVNVLGLSIGLASFLLITLWVQDELSFDSFHNDADNISVVFRVDNNKLSGATSKLLAPAIKEEIPEIVESTCFMPLPGSFKSLFRYNDRAFTESFALADKNFFNIFSFPFAEGDGPNAFSNPYSVVISEKMKEKYFGKEQALGKSILITFFGQTKALTVTGIMENIPHNSHIQSEIMLNVDFMKTFGINWDSWYNQAPSTYIKTSGKVSPEELAQKINTVKQNYFKEEKVGYSVMPLKKIHLNTAGILFFSAETSDIKYIYIFSAIAAVILLIASMNYINLSNALSLKRAREFGVKKTLGSKISQLIKQYFSETFLMVFISLFIAVFLVWAFLPAMNNLSGKELNIPLSGYRFITTLVAVLLITSLVSGIYPALFISSFHPLKVLKGKFATGKGSSSIRKGLIVFQFALSVIIIVCTIVISKQLKYIRNANLGYNKENLVCVSLNGEISGNYEAFKNEILKSGLITNITRSNKLESSTLSKTDDVNWPEKEDKFSSWVTHVDERFTDTYSIDMREGRFFSSEIESDFSNGFVINNTAAKLMEIDDPIGHKMEMWGRKGQIIGITEDFNFSSFHNYIEPLVMIIPKPEEANTRFRSFTFRIKANSLPESMDFLKKTMAAFYPEELFNYNFIEDSLNANYDSDFRMGKLFTYFSMLAIFIACLGLYGLTAFSMEQKNNEIGLYKVFGARVPSLLLKFSKNYLYQIAIANLIAWPVGYYFMNNWLSNFAYKTDISWWIFVIAGLLTFGIAILTVSFQSFKAATQNPVDALRYE